MEPRGGEALAHQKRAFLQHLTMVRPHLQVAELMTSMKPRLSVDQYAEKNKAGEEGGNLRLAHFWPWLTLSLNHPSSHRARSAYREGR